MRELSNENEWQNIRVEPSNGFNENVQKRVIVRDDAPWLDLQRLGILLKEMQAAHQKMMKNGGPESPY